MKATTPTKNPRRLSGGSSSSNTPTDSELELHPPGSVAAAGMAVAVDVSSSRPLGDEDVDGIADFDAGWNGAVAVGSEDAAAAHCSSPGVTTPGENAWVCCVSDSDGVDADVVALVDDVSDWESVPPLRTDPHSAQKRLRPLFACPHTLQIR